MTSRYVPLLGVIVLVAVTACSSNAVNPPAPGSLVGAPAAIINAIVDALSAYHVTDVPMPVTPERIWRIIQSARAQNEQ